MRILILILIALLFALPAAAQDNPFPDMNPADCQPVADYYRAEVNPWMGDTWLYFPPDDLEWLDRVNYADDGGVWTFWSGDQKHILHFSKYDLQPPNPTGEYPYTWGYHDVCYVLKVMHPLELAFVKIDQMWQRTYWAVALPYLIN